MTAATTLCATPGGEMMPCCSSHASQNVAYLRSCGFGCYTEPAEDGQQCFMCEDEDDS